MQKLQEAMASGNVVFILGTGVSAATTAHDQPATWTSLIRHGIDHVERLNPNDAPSWRILIESLISYGLKNGDPDYLINAATHVKTELLKHGEECYAQWLATTVGEMSVSNADLVEAIGSLDYPILTTNYDTLVESILGRSSTHWQDHQGIQQVLAGMDNSIGHIHGTWQTPSSVIFSLEDYERLKASQPAQTLQQAMSSFKSLVYLGCGSGLDDPNFSSLLGWHRATFRTSGITHFRLCLESELPTLTRTHAGDNIVPVSYGRNHDDLSPYIASLRRLVPSSHRTAAGIVRDVVQEARSSLVETIASDLVTGDIESFDEETIDSQVLPPLLLTIPHADYVKSRAEGSAGKKIPALSEINQVEYLVLAAEPETGLTTALRWMAWKSSLDLGSAVPLCVSFRECGKGHDPLSRPIRAKAREMGISTHSPDEMPEYILALDDVNPDVANIFDRVMRSIVDSRPISVIIGCRQGNEEAIVERLRQLGESPRLRYLSRLGDRDVVKLIERVHPSGGSDLAPAVIQVLRAEHLPRTPFAVSLLASVLVSGNSVASSASQTAILEQFVSMLLRRGDPHEDSRFTMDQPGREALLSNYAEHLARMRTAGVTELEASAFFEATMRGYDWPDSASAVVNHFVELKILKTVDGRVEFARSAFLFLFAAKRAHFSSEFLAHLLKDPLYYASVIHDYSALVRGDAQTLKSIFAHLPPSSETGGSRSPYEILIPAPPAIDSISRDGRDREEELDQKSRAENDDAPDPNDDHDDHDDRDIVPFPVDSTAQLSPLRRLMRSLDLISRVLRDSDQIQDLELKEEVFARVLEGWGHLVSAIHDDGQYLEMFLGMIEAGDDWVELRSKHPEAFPEIVQAMSRVIPAAIAVGGIEASLSSRKLIGAFERVASSGAFGDSDECAFAACMFAFVLREKGWASHVRAILASRGNFWLARNFFFHILCESYASVGPNAVAERDSAATLEVLVEMIDRSTSFKSEAERVRHLDDFRRTMRSRRTAAATRSRLAPSEVA